MGDRAGFNFFIRLAMWGVDDVRVDAERRRDAALM
jgi:hypothetical protein